MPHSSRLVKLYLRVELPTTGDAYRADVARLLLRWQLSLNVQAFEVKEGSALEVSYYAEIDSEEYQAAFVDYHERHAWNVDEIKLLGLAGLDAELEQMGSVDVCWSAEGGSSPENEAWIFWQRPGRGEDQKSLDCWLVKYDGSPTNRDGTPSAVENKGAPALVYRKGLLFCAPYSEALQRKFVRLSFKWERFLREQEIPFLRMDNFADFESD